jgi:hypothetical protein
VNRDAALPAVNHRMNPNWRSCLTDDDAVRPGAPWPAVDHSPNPNRKFCPADDDTANLDAASHAVNHGAPLPAVNHRQNPSSYPDDEDRVNIREPPARFTAGEA